MLTETLMAGRVLVFWIEFCLKFENDSRKIVRAMTMYKETNLSVRCRWPISNLLAWKMSRLINIAETHGCDNNVEQTSKKFEDRLTCSAGCRRRRWLPVKSPAECQCRPHVACRRPDQSNLKIEPQITLQSLWSLCKGTKHSPQKA